MGDLISRNALLDAIPKNDELLSVDVRRIICESPKVDAKPVITGETSDGYHTFNELYHHRAVLFSVIVKAFPERAWKARQHHDGTMYSGMFIVGIDTPEGQASYHYDIDPYWDMFECRELERAPEWDGHTPAQAIERIRKLEPLRRGECQYIIDDVNDCDCSLGKDAYDYIKQLEHYISEIAENVEQLKEAHVVRCRDCEFWEGTQDSLQGKCLLTGEYPAGGWYCANGKIKEAE